MSLQAPETSDFLEAVPQRWTRSLIWVFLGMVAALAAWAGNSRVDVSVSGRGSLVPAVPPLWVTAPTDGSLHEIRVHLGDSVGAGDVLFTVMGQAVKAPQAGWVAAVRLAPGASVYEGDPVLGICPTGTPYAFEALVANRDISQVRLNQVGMVHLDAFPVEEFGSIPALVQSIQPVLDSPEHPYRVLLRLGRQNQVGSHHDVQPLLPALTGEAELVTGHQTLLELVLHTAR